MEALLYANMLFDTIAKMTKETNIPDVEIQLMSAEIIQILKSRNLTYEQAKRTLEVVHDTLKAMQCSMLL